MNFNKLNTIVGWIVFAIAATVYILSAEPTGSLWDCGEFITGAYKMEVVHPPGAPFFMMVGHMFTRIAQLVSDDPAMIAYSVNVMSGICTAFVAMFICWVTSMLSKMTMVGRSDEMTDGQLYAALGSGLVAGLATTFATSVWFSAVEGEVYAMASFFTAIVVWSVVKWYHMEDSKQADRWLIFAILMVALSLGVHLLSLLTLPAMALLYYYKKTEEPSFVGILGAMAAGVVLFGLVVQTIVMKGFPIIGSVFDKFFVNDMGMPFNSGLLFFGFLMLVLIAGGLWFFSKRGSTHIGVPLLALSLLAFPALGAKGVLLIVGAGVSFFLTEKKIDNSHLQKMLVGFGMLVLGFSTYALILIRANANTPINMNNPSDAYSLLSYLNREQYGDRPLLYGPHFDAEPIGTDEVERIGQAGDRYEVVDRKLSYKYNSRDMMLFPRIGHYDRKNEHRRWMGNGSPSKKRPTTGYNINFLFEYQMGWMYWRYFMWNFVGRQNSNQGYYNWNPKDGNWISGIKPLDSFRLYNQSKLTTTMKNHKARNTYFFLPFIFGLLGLFYHFSTRKYDAFAIFVLFLMTGLAIIIYSNQPPNEPRERDYVLAGSMFTFCIWIGMGVTALFDMLKNRASGNIAAIAATAIVLSAPIIMGFQNWDDHSRAQHTGARDYASNFLESCQPNAIVFTHGDNDTYPLWYAQEVEGIRTDVRVVNLSLLAVDWYINQLRRKVNDSPPIKMTMPPEAYRGNKRNVIYNNPTSSNQKMTIQQVMQFVSKNQPRIPEEMGSYIPTSNIVIPVNKTIVMTNGTVTQQDTGQVLTELPIRINKERLIKDEIAILDIIASNNWERPIYYAVTCRPEKLLGLSDYLQLEGLASRIVPIKTKGDQEYSNMPIGQGRVDTDLMYDNIMNKFRWGNFDKHDAFIDQSYMPSVASIRFAMLRLSNKLIAKGDKEKAKNIIDKHFEAFPHMNFPYDYNAMYMLRLYNDIGAEENAKPHLKILAKEAKERMDFYDSLDNDTREKVFRSESENWLGIMAELQEMVVRNPGYADIKQEITDMFSGSLPQGMFKD